MNNELIPLKRINNVSNFRLYLVFNLIEITKETVIISELVIFSSITAEVFLFMYILKKIPVTNKFVV